MSHINQEHIQQEILPIFQTTHTGGKKSSNKKSTDKKSKKVKKGGGSIPIQTGTYTSTAPVVPSEFSPLPSQNVVMPISVPDMPGPPTTTLAIGGAQKSKKKSSKGKKGGDCKEDDEQEGEQEDEQEGGKKSSKGKGKGKKGKKGGALMNDLQNLAVPFAILLAKQGLESMFSSNEKDASKSSKKTKTMKGGDCGCSGTAIPPVGAPITGGSTNLPKKSLAGGSAKPQKAGKKAITQKFMSLTETIDNFLQKY
jgi:hypothetical protein